MDRLHWSTSGGHRLKRSGTRQAAAGNPKNCSAAPNHRSGSQGTVPSRGDHMRTVNFGGCFIACERAKEECGAQSDRRPSWVRPTLCSENLMQKVIFAAFRFSLANCYAAMEKRAGLLWKQMTPNTSPTQCVSPTLVRPLPITVYTLPRPT